MADQDHLLIDAAYCASASSANDVASGDWDEEVRQAFFVACMRQEIRAEMARRELVRTTHGARARELIATFAASSDEARVGWATIDRCLAVHGELAALALDRCIEETSLQLRRPSGIFAAKAVPPQRARSLVAENEEIARSIVGRARERLSWFRARRLGA